MKNKGQVGSLIGVMIALVVGLSVVFNVISNQVDSSTQKFSFANDTFTMDGAGGVAELDAFADTGKTDKILASTLHVYNNTDCTNSELSWGNFTLIDNETSAPKLDFVGTTGLNGSAQRNGCAVYDYAESQYTGDNTIATILRLFPLVIAVLLLTTVAVLIGV